MNARSIFTDEEIIRIYNDEYIEKHHGGTTLERKYGCSFYDDFHRLGLELRDNREKNRKYSCNTDYFKDIDTEEKAYWLGFMYADGYISHQQYDEDIKRFGISIMENDVKHLEKFSKAINSTYPINHYTVRQGYKIGAKYCRIVISDDMFARNLMNHGCIEHKSNIVEPPIGLPKIYEKHFIRGFMDANGCIARCETKSGSLSFTIRFSSTESVLNWIQDHLIENNIIFRKYPLRKRKEEHIVTAFDFGGNYLTKMYLDYIYSDATVWLDRKHDRYLELCNLIYERNNNKRDNRCAYCGTTNSNEFILWTHGGEYEGKILCGKHYQQLVKYGRIIPDKKDCCDICGSSNGRLTHVGKKYPKYHGSTLCLKHYNQLMYHGDIIDKEEKDKNIDEQLCGVSSTYNAESA